MNQVGYLLTTMDWAVMAGRSANNSVAWVALIRGHADRTALIHNRSSDGHRIDPSEGICCETLESQISKPYANLQ